MNKDIGQWIIDVINFSKVYKFKLFPITVAFPYSKADLRGLKRDRALFQLLKEEGLSLTLIRPGSLGIGLMNNVAEGMLVLSDKKSIRKYRLFNLLAGILNDVALLTLVSILFFLHKGFNAISAIAVFALFCTLLLSPVIRLLERETSRISKQMAEERKTLNQLIERWNELNAE